MPEFRSFSKGSTPSPNEQVSQEIDPIHDQQADGQQTGRRWLTFDLHHQGSTLPRDSHRPEDEYANLVTHGIGFALSIIASVILMDRALDHQAPEIVIACGIYSFSLIGLYLASALSHAFHKPSWRRFFRAADQAFIFLLIAGSYTPFGIVYGPSRWMSPMLLAMWTLAILGVGLVIWLHELPPRLQLLYGILGWLPAISIGTIINAGPANMVILIVLGGLCYSLGAIFLVLDHRVRYFHAAWHLSVIAGSTAHYFAILLMLSALHAA